MPRPVRPDILGDSDLTHCDLLYTARHVLEWPFAITVVRPDRLQVLRVDGSSFEVEFEVNSAEEMLEFVAICSEDREQRSLAVKQAEGKTKTAGWVVMMRQNKDSFDKCI